ncbi:unnamed protein product, partial [Heterosigma akashiwo]
MDRRSSTWGPPPPPRPGGRQQPRCALGAGLHVPLLPRFCSMWWSALLSRLVGGARGRAPRGGAVWGRSAARAVAVVGAHCRAAAYEYGAGWFAIYLSWAGAGVRGVKNSIDLYYLWRCAPPVGTRSG